MSSLHLKLFTHTYSASHHQQLPSAPHPHATCINAVSVDPHEPDDVPQGTDRRLKKYSLLTGSRGGGSGVAWLNLFRYPARLAEPTPNKRPNLRSQCNLPRRHNLSRPLKYISAPTSKVCCGRDATGAAPPSRRNSGKNAHTNNTHAPTPLRISLQQNCLVRHDALRHQPHRTHQKGRSRNHAKAPTRHPVHRCHTQRHR